MSPILEGKNYGRFLRGKFPLYLKLRDKSGISKS